MRRTTSRRIRVVAAGGTALLLAAWGLPAFAGMPVFTLSDAASLRLSGISFFVVVMLAAAWGVKALWNTLRTDFNLPVLNYRKALALVILLGLTFNVVLLMVAGTRELMTPGAWEKSEVTYRLRESPRAAP